MVAQSTYRSTTASSTSLALDFVPRRRATAVERVEHGRDRGEGRAETEVPRPEDVVKSSACA